MSESNWEDKLIKDLDEALAEGEWILAGNLSAAYLRIAAVKKGSTKTFTTINQTISLPYHSASAEVYKAARQAARAAIPTEEE